MAETIITVRGEHEIEHPAELGVVRLTVAFDGSDREVVLRSMTERHTAVTTHLAELTDATAGPITQWTAHDIAVWSYRPWNDAGTQLPPVYRGSAEVSATFNDFTRLAGWLSEISVLSGVTVGGIDWRLSRETERTVLRESRRTAVVLARTKAADYAESLDLALAYPIAVADVGLLIGSSSPDSGRFAASPRMLATGAGTPDLQLKPEDITVTAAVEARFAAR